MNTMEKRLQAVARVPMIVSSGVEKGNAKATIQCQWRPARGAFYHLPCGPFASHDGLFHVDAARIGRLPGRGAGDADLLWTTGL